MRWVVPQPSLTLSHTDLLQLYHIPHHAAHIETFMAQQKIEGWILKTTVFISDPGYIVTVRAYAQSLGAEYFQVVGELRVPYHVPSRRCVLM